MPSHETAHPSGLLDSAESTAFTSLSGKRAFNLRIIWRMFGGGGDRSVARPRTVVDFGPFVAVFIAFMAVLGAIAEQCSFVNQLHNKFSQPLWSQNV